MFERSFICLFSKAWIQCPLATASSEFCGLESCSLWIVCSSIWACIYRSEFSASPACGASVCVLTCLQAEQAGYLWEEAQLQAVCRDSPCGCQRACRSQGPHWRPSRVRGMGVYHTYPPPLGCATPESGRSLCVLQGAGMRGGLRWSRVAAGGNLGERRPQHALGWELSSERQHVPGQSGLAPSAFFTVTNKSSSQGPGASPTLPVAQNPIWAPAPVRPQQSWSPAPSQPCPAWPWALLSWALPWAHVLAWPQGGAWCLGLPCCPLALAGAVKRGPGSSTVALRSHQPPRWHDSSSEWEERALMVSGDWWLVGGPRCC